jgi:circadian clock protein KaiC
MSDVARTNKNICKTGVPGLDVIVGGGLPKDQLYLIQGKPGTGKTTMAMQFLLEGARTGENTLYITFSETKAEIDAVAQSHNWDLSKIRILELSTINQGGGVANQTTLFHPSEVEMSKTIAFLLDQIKETKATRIVFDSMSELRLLSETSLRYRRQMLAFKEFFINRGATVLFLDDLTTEAGDLHVQSIVHGVLLLEKFRAGYGVERRQFHIVKLRGVNFRGGTHDYLIQKGGIQIFPRLIASDTKDHDFTRSTLSSGVKELDQLLGGGLDRGTSNLILGPAGSGKSTIALRFAVTAAQNGKKVSIYNFEESSTNFVARADALGLNLTKYLESGQIALKKVDPAELTPGQFASLLRHTSQDENVDMVIIDSLNGYIHAMPEQQFLMLQLHELLAYLGARGVVTIMILAQAGIMGTMQTPLDLTYLADSVIITRFFEAFGSVKKAIAVVKKRTGAHEETLRELKMGPGGVIVGPVLKDFAGIFSGMPKFVGSINEIMRPQDE